MTTTHQDKMRAAQEAIDAVFLDTTSRVDLRESLLTLKEHVKSCLDALEEEE